MCSRLVRPICTGAAVCLPARLLHRAPFHGNRLRLCHLIRVKKRAPCGALARRTKPKDRDSISVHDVSSFCNPDHRSSQGSGRAPNRQGGGRRAETQSRPPHAARSRSRATRAEGADANGRPRPGRRESRARQREGAEQGKPAEPPRRAGTALSSPAPGGLDYRSRGQLSSSGGNGSHAHRHAVDQPLRR